jgi:hypothetical protein
MLLGNPALHLSIACSVLHMFAMYLSVSFPSSLSVDPGTDVVPETDAAPEIDDPTDDPAFAAEQPNKNPPFEHAYIAYSFSLLLALEFATAWSYPILMHSLFIVTYY